MATTSLAGLLLGLAISYKVTPALFIPYFAYKRSWRTVGFTFLGLALFLLAVPSLIIGPRFNLQCLQMWWHRMLTPFLVEGSTSPQEINQSLMGVLTRLFTEITPGTNRYDLHLDVNLVSWPPKLVSYLVKALAVGLVGLLAFFCRTRISDRRDPRLLGEVVARCADHALRLGAKLEASFRHALAAVHVSRLGALLPPQPTGPAWSLGGVLVASFVLMATTSSEFGGLFADGKGHEIAQGYGMFLWAAVVLYAAVAWRLWARRGDQAPGWATSDRSRRMRPISRTGKPKPDGLSPAEKLRRFLRCYDGGASLRR